MWVDEMLKAETYSKPQRCQHGDDYHQVFQVKPGPLMGSSGKAERAQDTVAAGSVPRQGHRLLPPRPILYPWRSRERAAPVRHFHREQSPSITVALTKALACVSCLSWRGCPALARNEFLMWLTKIKLPVKSQFIH